MVLVFYWGRQIGKEVIIQSSMMGVTEIYRYDKHLAYKQRGKHLNLTWGPKDCRRNDN